MRYPGDPYMVEDGELSAMIALAASVLAEVQSRVPGK
jgi:hypothetical protein